MRRAHAEELCVCGHELARHKTVDGSGRLACHARLPSYQWDGKPRQRSCACSDFLSEETRDNQKRVALIRENEKEAAAARTNRAKSTEPAPAPAPALELNASPTFGEKKPVKKKARRKARKKK